MPITVTTISAGLCRDQDEVHEEEIFVMRVCRLIVPVRLVQAFLIYWMTLNKRNPHGTFCVRCVATHSFQHSSMIWLQLNCLLPEKWGHMYGFIYITYPEFMQFYGMWGTSHKPLPSCPRTCAAGISATARESLARDCLWTLQHGRGHEYRSEKWGGCIRFACFC